jgi:Xaa-Pro aminopeptidase
MISLRLRSTRSLVLFAALALPLTAAEGNEGPPAAQDKQMRCGLGKAFHGGRRAELRERLKTGVVLVRGLPQTRDYAAFHQDKVFWYLTGVESQNATLLMNCATGVEILFLPGHDSRKEFWDGELWDADDDWVSGLTGFDDVRDRKALMDVLEGWLEPQAKVWISTHPNLALSGGYDQAIPYDRAQAEDPLDGRASREEALQSQLETRFEVQVESFTAELNAMRWVKTPEELEAMRHASRVGCDAMAEAMRSTRPGLGEWELDALMSWSFVRGGATGPGYHAIVGSGPNSCVLHYSASTRVMREGELVLVDYAPEYDHYVSDITRTWPVDGTFDERQAKLYDIVLEAQQAALAAVEPGVTLREVGAAAKKVLSDNELQLPHGVSHWIGMEVHDVAGPGRKSFDLPLEPGVCFTVEPGYYDAETGTGIRIEDVVVVTEDGHENMTASLPRERAAVEALIAELGILDVVDGHAR